MRPAKAQAQLPIYSLRRLQKFIILTISPQVMTIVIYSPLPVSSITHFLTEISSYETTHNGASGMGMQCLPLSHKVITQANCFIPITHAQLV